MRAKSQTALPELAGEKRPRQKSVLGLGFLVSLNRLIIHILWAVWPLARMSWTRRRQRFAWNRLWLRSGVRCETSGLGERFSAELGHDHAGRCVPTSTASNTGRAPAGV